METRYTKTATKALTRMQPKKATQIMDAIARIAAKPEGQHANVTKMEGMENTFRVRIGDWRAVYELDGNTLKVLIVKPRGGAYK